MVVIKLKTILKIGNLSIPCYVAELGSLPNNQYYAGIAIPTCEKQNINIYPFASRNIIHHCELVPCSETVRIRIPKYIYEKLESEI